MDRFEHDLRLFFFFCSRCIYYIYFTKSSIYRRAGYIFPISRTKWNLGFWEQFNILLVKIIYFEVHKEHRLLQRILEKPGHSLFHLFFPESFPYMDACRQYFISTYSTYRYLLGGSETCFCLYHKIRDKQCDSCSQEDDFLGRETE